MDVYKRTWKNSKGEMTTSNTYYFKTTINDKRKEVNTKKSNIKEAKIEMNKLIRNSGISIPKSKKNKKQVVTVYDVMKEKGWLNAATNPKYINAEVQGKPYGIKQAQKISSALNHLFKEEILMEDLNEEDLKNEKIIPLSDFDEYLKENNLFQEDIKKEELNIKQRKKIHFRDFIYDNQILPTAKKFDDYENFITKPFFELTKEDANNFVAFLFKYKKWDMAFRAKVKSQSEKNKTTLKSSKEFRNQIRVMDKFFICSNTMNIIALKAFFTYCFNTNITSSNIFANLVIPRSKEPKRKPFFNMEQLDVIFDNDVAEKALKGISKTPIYKAHKFLALTGMRSGEVRALNWGQISNDNHEVLITQSSHTLQTTDSK